MHMIVWTLMISQMENHVPMKFDLVMVNVIVECHVKLMSLVLL